MAAKEGDDDGSEGGVHQSAKFLKIENIVCGQGWGNGYACAVGEASLEGKSSVNNSGLKQKFYFSFIQKSKLVGCPGKKGSLAA